MHAARFLDGFGFDYEFASSTDYYSPASSTRRCCKMLAVYDEVMDIILPTPRPGSARDLFAVPADLASDGQSCCRCR
jgi:lysyl-tRNA synthetase class I